MRRGVTLAEMAVALAIVGIVSAIAYPRAAGWLDRLAVSRAANEVAGFYQTARFSAILRAQRVRMEFRPDSLIGAFEGPRDSVFLRWAGPSVHRVNLTASQVSIAIQPNGLGFAAANTKIVLRRGMVAESLTTSRLGRLRRWR